MKTINVVNEHLNSTFSQTDNVMTYGTLYICLLVPIAAVILIICAIRKDYLINNRIYND